MKICDITQAYTPTGGGIRTYLHEKRRFIQDCTTHQHLLIVPGEDDVVTHEGRLIKVTIASPLIPKCEPYRFILRLEKVAEILDSFKPDVIEIGTGYALPLAVLYHRRHCRCVLVGYYHTDYPAAYIEPVMHKLFGGKFARQAMRLGERYVSLVHNEYDVTLTSSLSMQQRMQELGVSSVEVIPLGVDLGLFNPRKRDYALRRRFGISDHDLMLIYTGRLDKEKRIDFVVRAFNKMSTDKNAFLVVIGEGPLKDMLSQLAGSNPRILVLPFQNDREMLARMLASADIYVTAGPHETFALSVLEAQASGLPVVGVNAGALIERVPESTGLLAQADSEDNMAALIEELSANGFRDKGRNARILVEQNFSWQRTFETMFDLYEKLYRQNFSQHHRSSKASQSF